MTVVATPTGETVLPASSETTGTPPVTPPASNGGGETISKAEFDKLAQERNMYRNQLAEKETSYTEALTKAQKAADDAQALADTERIARENIEKAQLDREKAATVKSKETELLSGYSDDVRELATDLGVNLSDAEDEDAIDLFKQKLDKLNAKVSGTTPPKKQPPVSGNNGTPPKVLPKKSDVDELADLETSLKGVTF